MVAAWIKADTGVGPSIASGSQICKGNHCTFTRATNKYQNHRPCQCGNTQEGSAQRSTKGFPNPVGVNLSIKL
jgi:hypothetical protein